MTDRLFQRLAWLLPRRLAYWCYIRVAAWATHEHPTRPVYEITIMDALEAWPDDRAR